MTALPFSLSPPVGWHVHPFGRVVDRSQKSGQPDARSLSVFIDQGVVPRDSRDDNFNRLGGDLSKYLVVRQGDIVFNKLRTWQGGLGVSKFDGIVSPAYFVCRPRATVEPRYLHYLLRSRLYLEELTRISKWMPPSQFDISWDDLRSLSILNPSLTEQRAIADYLDPETARIDALIAAKRRMVELMEERFTAQMMELLFANSFDRLAPLGRMCTCLAGYSFSSEEFVYDEPEAIKLLRGVNVSPGNVRWEDVVYWPRHLVDARMSKYSLRATDLVVGMDRPVIQSGMRVASIEPSDLPALLVQRVARIRANSLSTNDFLRYALMSPAFQEHFSPITTGVSVPHISEEQILSFRLPMMALADQARVVTALKRAEARLTRLRAVLQHQLGLLQERRQALITAAVTGQLDIAEAA